MPPPLASAESTPKLGVSGDRITAFGHRLAAPHTRGFAKGAPPSTITGSRSTLWITGIGPPPSATALPRPTHGALGARPPPSGIIASSPTLRILGIRPPPSATAASIPHAHIYPTGRPISHGSATPRLSVPRRARSHQRPFGPPMAHASRAQNPRPGTGGYCLFCHLMPIAHRLLLSLIRPATARPPPGQKIATALPINLEENSLELVSASRFPGNFPPPPSQPPKPRTVALPTRYRRATDGAFSPLALVNAGLSAGRLGPAAAALFPPPAASGNSGAIAYPKARTCNPFACSLPS